MLQSEHPIIKELLLKGKFGLEKEGLRITGDGHLSHAIHPFQQYDHIVRDFCENQTEINTSVMDSAEEAVKALAYYNRIIEAVLSKQRPREYLWPFSNPPYISSEKDIPIAAFKEDRSKTLYREYLAKRYGRYKMTFSGIHVNYSFHDELLQKSFQLSGASDYTIFKNSLYLTLAKRMTAYGWLLVALTAASPLLDSSYIEKGKFGNDEFIGMASVRCSDMGYWNAFTPVLDYTDVNAYADSIQQYVDMGWIKAPSELYYPIRLKPKGENHLDSLRNQGISHIELRMFDLNPLRSEGIDVRDLKFAQLMMGWLASTPETSFESKDQIQAIQNLKNAARYDLKTVKILFPNGKTYSVVRAARSVIKEMREFYQFGSNEIRDILNFEEEKLVDPEKRYAWQIRKKYDGGYVKKGIELVKQRQEDALNYV